MIGPHENGFQGPAMDLHGPLLYTVALVKSIGYLVTVQNETVKVL